MNSNLFFQFDQQQEPESDGYTIVCKEVIKDCTGDKAIIKSLPCVLYLAPYPSKVFKEEYNGVYIYIQKEGDLVKKGYKWYVGQRKVGSRLNNKRKYIYSWVFSVKLSKGYTPSNELKFMENFLILQLKRSRVKPDLIANKVQNKLGEHESKELENKLVLITEAIKQVWLIVFHFMSYEFGQLKDKDDRAKSKPQQDPGLLNLKTRNNKNEQKFEFIQDYEMTTSDLASLLKYRWCNFYDLINKIIDKNNKEVLLIVKKRPTYEKRVHSAINNRSKLKFTFWDYPELNVESTSDLFKTQKKIKIQKGSSFGVVCQFNKPINTYTNSTQKLYKKIQNNYKSLINRKVLRDITQK